MQRGDEVVYLKPRAMEVLLYMARKAPNPVDVNEFIEQLWFPNVVGNENVKVIINKLRAALGESAP
jgi:DNA-binding winged helix-turn-helix (wHTH) protein|tara:strand:+ start:2566 stop:2763 length:198 start_codon:yes stop_codon:yes gene_type:complete